MAAIDAAERRTRERFPLAGFAKRGIVPESGGTWYLPRFVGWAKACEASFVEKREPNFRGS